MAHAFGGLPRAASKQIHHQRKRLALITTG
jgi:hypothetical protein